MKKKKQNVNILLIVLIPVVIFLGYLCYARLFADHTPPVITLDSDTLTVSVYDEEDALLAGVTAEDNRDGDLTASVVVEKKTPLSEDGKRTVIYAVIDSKGNVGRAERTVTYTEHESARFSLQEPLRFPINVIDYDILESIGAESALDGDLTSAITCQTGFGFDYTQTGMHDLTFSVTDSTGTTASLSTVAEFYDPEKEPYTITLTDYLVYVEKGEYFDPMTYYEGSDLGTEPEITSDVNTDEPGVYHVTYTVGSEDAAGVSRLVVVVTN